jgi:DNA-binding Lrp family transcriptional regulator
MWRIDTGSNYSFLRIEGDSKMMTRAVEVLGRKYSVDILRAANEPRSVSWLSQQLDIPIATCYRRVKELSENMYLRGFPVDGSTDRTKYYRTTDRVEINLASHPLISTSRGWKAEELTRDIKTLDSVPDDDFSRAIDSVEGYFGDLIDEVAVHAPVSRRQLVAVLARAQLSGHQLASDGLTDNGDIVHQSNDETLMWLDRSFWSTLHGLHQLGPNEGRAAREVHRRLIESMAGDVADYNRERDPFILINGLLRR